MLYVGHFSFDALDDDNRQRHGYFTCVMDAADEETAAAKLAGFILETKKKQPVFQEIVKVYLEDLIAIGKPPTDPVITLLQSSDGPFPDSVSHSLPGVTRPDISAFGLPSNVKRQESEPKEGSGYLFDNPFIQFREDIMENKDEYLQKFNAKIKEWDAQLEQLKMKAKQMDAEVKDEYQKTIENLKQKQRASKEKLKELQTSGGDAWQDMKIGMERAWADIDASFRAAMTRFK